MTDDMSTIRLYTTTTESEVTCLRYDGSIGSELVRVLMHCHVISAWYTADIILSVHIKGAFTLWIQQILPPTSKNWNCPQFWYDNKKCNCYDLYYCCRGDDWDVNRRQVRSHNDHYNNCHRYSYRNHLRMLTLRLTFVTTVLTFVFTFLMQFLLTSRCWKKHNGNSAVERQCSESKIKQIMQIMQTVMREKLSVSVTQHTTQ